MKANIPLLSWLFLAGLLAGLPAQARNIDLSTVPERATVQLTIYNAEDITLVRETRSLSFKKGGNPLQFSWANTLIDPTSVELKFLEHAAELEVLDTMFPHDKPEMLYWNVASEYEGEARVEISYFTSGISWRADYTAISNPEETRLSLESFVRVLNQSGEDYENAEVRLVVGKINLVERIAELAAPRDRGEGRTMKIAGLDGNARDMTYQALREELMADEAVGMMRSAPAAAIPEPKEVAKEGLSEYFIYTIEGTETIPDGWSKRLRSFEAGEVPVKIEYRYRPREYGDKLVRLYLMTNAQTSGLGETPLPDGKVRIFRENGRDGLGYLAEQDLQYIPIGDKIELNLGEDPEVIFELVKLRVHRDEILMKLQGVDVYHKLNSGVRFDLKSQVAGWNEHETYSQRIRNYTAKPIDLEIRRVYQGDVLYVSQLDPALHDYRTVELKATVQPGEIRDLYHEVITRHGKNAKKNNVELVTGEVAP